jgi:hypothetical protein
MPITRTPIIDDDGSGTTGTVLDNAWKQELYGQIDAIGGAPINSPAFTGNPTAPTPPPADNDTSIATTAYVQAAIGAVPPAATQGTWTPVDASGAGLAFAGQVGKWSRVGNMLTIWGQVVFPTTSNALGASIGGFPVPNGGGIISGFYTVYGAAMYLHMAVGSSVGLIYSATNGAPRLNSDLSTQYVIFTGSYLIG